MKIDYHVAVSVKEAASMSFELSEKLIEQNLADLPFYADFLCGSLSAIAHIDADLNEMHINLP